MKSYSLLLLFLAGGVTFAQDRHTANEPLEYVYKTIGSDSLKAYVFFPSEKQEGETSPALAVFHGGGWAAGDPSWGFERARRFAQMGLVAISVQYRLSDQVSVTPIDAMEDAKDFFLWARENSSILKIQRDRIAAYGWSAGGHLIAGAAVFPKFNRDMNISSVPDILILHSPAVSVINDGWFEQLLLHRGDPADLSPAENITGSMPPSIIVIGRDDTVAPLKYSEYFQHEMVRHGNICELIIYDGVGHLFTPSDQPDNEMPNPDKEVTKKAFDEIDGFLQSRGYIE